MADGLPDEPTALRVSGDGADDVLDAVDAPIPAAAVGPTGAVGLEPLAMVTVEGSTAFYPRCPPGTAADLAAGLADGDLDTAGAAAIVDHGTAPATLPVPPLSPLDTGVREVLGRCGWTRPTSRADYEATGGFAALDRADEAFDADVAGRGWGDGSSDAPVAEHWERIRDADADPAVVVNAHGTAADRLLLESTPLTVLEGALVAAKVIDADEVVFFVNERDATARERAAVAVDAVDTDAAVDVVAGPDEYKAGEPTMALEAIEGSHRLEARLRPPGPEEVGLHGRPTAVHTPRTLAAVVHAVAGDGPPTRLVTVTGDVSADATVELPTGASLSAAVDAVEVEGGFKAACVGGAFGGVTPDLDAEVGSLAATGLGTEGVVEVLGDERCIVGFVGERSRFAEEENCGRCVPCREGSKQLTAMLRDVYDGRYRRDAIDELLSVMGSTSICRFGIDAPRPVRTALDAFEAEFEEHANGTCPTGACERGEHTPEVSR